MTSSVGARRWPSRRRSRRCRANGPCRRGSGRRQWRPVVAKPLPSPSTRPNTAPACERPTDGLFPKPACRTFPCAKRETRARELRRAFFQVDFGHSLRQAKRRLDKMSFTRGRTSAIPIKTLKRLFRAITPQLGTACRWRDCLDADPSDRRLFMVIAWTRKPAVPTACLEFQ